MFPHIAASPINRPRDGMNKYKRRRNKKGRNRRSQQWGSNQPQEWYGPDITGSFVDDPDFLDEATFAARDDRIQDNYYSRGRGGGRLAQS